MKSSSLLPLEYFKDLFQFDNCAIEKDVPLLQDFYAGLRPEALYTSLSDLYSLQTHPLAKGSWLDLGCGIGVSALMYGALYPDRKSFGIEAVSSRLNVGKDIQNQLRLTNVSLIQSNLLDCNIPQADIFFLYFPTGHVLDRMLFELGSFNYPFKLVAIESHGDLLPRLRRESWLNEVSATQLESTRHHPEAIWFESTRSLRQMDGPHQLSFQHRVLKVQDENCECWLGESFGMTWSHDNTFDLLTPPRSLDWQQIVSVSDESDMSPELSFLYHLRQRGAVSIRLKTAGYYGHIRKIIISPTFSVEISTGQKLKWQDIQSIHWDQFLCYESSSSYYFLPHVPK